MIARLPFAIGAAIALALMLSLALAAMKPARPPMIQTQGMPFHERWQEPPLMPKAIRTIPITPRVRPEPVKAVSAPTPQRAVEPPPHRYVAPEEQKKRSRKREEPVVKDICTRHGLRKVTTNNGRSWRCKRS